MLWNTSQQGLKREAPAATQKVQILEAHTDYVTALRFEPTHQFLFSAGMDQQILQWDLEHSLDPIRSFKEGEAQFPHSGQFLPFQQIIF